MPTLDGHSKAVGWLKIGLPILGLGILSTLFLIAREARIEQGEMSEEFLAPDGSVEAVSNPDYSGVTGDGSSVAVTADLAWPKADGSGRLEASNLSARFDMIGGERADIRADRGEIEPDENVIKLRGNVIVETVSGWTIRGETFDAWLDWTRLRSPTAVRTEGPIGVLDAGNMMIQRDTGTEGTYLMEFDGGVHLVYRPWQEGFDASFRPSSFGSAQRPARTRPGHRIRAVPAGS
jgi:lipopolysaccharide export system protein LptC